MPRRVGVLGSENWSDAEDTFSSTCDLKLFVELRRLSEECILAKVRQFEDIATTFGRCADEARRLELLELTVLKV